MKRLKKRSSLGKRQENSGIIERLIFKMTSGRFIFTLVVAGVYAYLACSQKLPEDRVNEITLVVLYAYFNRPRTEIIDVSELNINDSMEDPEGPEDTEEGNN